MHRWPLSPISMIINIGLTLSLATAGLNNFIYIYFISNFIIYFSLEPEIQYIQIFECTCPLPCLGVNMDMHMVMNMDVDKNVAVDVDVDLDMDVDVDVDIEMEMDLKIWT